MTWLKAGEAELEARLAARQAELAGGGARAWNWVDLSKPSPQNRTGQQAMPLLGPGHTLIPQTSFLRQAPRDELTVIGTPHSWPHDSTTS